MHPCFVLTTTSTRYTEIRNRILTFVCVCVFMRVLGFRLEKVKYTKNIAGEKILRI